MKKFVAIMLAALLLLCLIGCNNNQTEDEGGNDDKKTEEVMIYNNFEYAVNDIGKYEIVGYITDGAEVLELTLPVSINEIEVTGIGVGAFKALKNLKSVSFPADSKYTYIAQTAFWGCSALEEITISNTITTIGVAAFGECENLKTVNFSNTLTTIDDHAFAHCKALTAVQLPATLQTIGVGAFNDCDALTTITIPESVTFIGKGAFVECKNLGDIVLSVKDHWYQPSGVDKDGNFLVDDEKNVIYVAIDAAALADSSDVAALLNNGTQLKRILPAA